MIGYYLATRDLLVYQYVEPFWMFGLFGTTAMWIALGVLLAATVFVRNLYCRFLCPVGATLGLLSYLTVFRIKRWSECDTCKICQKACQWGAIEGPKILMTECVRCDDCERLYADTADVPALADHRIQLAEDRHPAFATQCSRIHLRCRPQQQPGQAARISPTTQIMIGLVSA